MGRNSVLWFDLVLKIRKKKKSLSNGAPVFYGYVTKVHNFVD